MQTGTHSLGTRIANVPTSANDSTASAIHTASLLGLLARDAQGYPEFHEFVNGVCSRGTRGQLDLCSEVFYAVQRTLVFRTDGELVGVMRAAGTLEGIGPVNDATAELIHHPVVLVRTAAERKTTVPGDCDDFAGLTAALLIACGISGRFVLIAADPKTPKRLSHIYVQADTTDAGPVAMDTSHGEYPGWAWTEHTGRVDVGF